VVKHAPIAHPSVSARSIEDAISEYLDDAAARARGRTLELYASVLRRHLLTWATANGLSRTDELGQRSVSRWVAYLRSEHRTPKGEPLSEFSVRTYVRAVNSFLKWLDAGGRAKAPVPKRQVLEVLTRAEIDRLEAAAPTERDKLLIRLLADTGARLGEILALREQDVQEQGRREHVVRLGGKTGGRLAPISPGLYRRLRRYVEHGRPAGYFGDRVFVGLHSVRGGTYRTPGRGTIEAMVRDAASRAGIRRRVYPHLLRHSALTHLLRKGVNPLLVAQVAGHSSLEMIRGTYAHLTVSDAHQAVMRALVDDGDE
jgi:integrase/recombinase XerD